MTCRLRMFSAASCLFLGWSKASLRHIHPVLVLCDGTARRHQKLIPSHWRFTCFSFHVLLCVARGATVVGRGRGHEPKRKGGSGRDQTREGIRGGGLHVRLLVGVLVQVPQHILEHDRLVVDGLVGVIVAVEGFGNLHGAAAEGIKGGGVAGIREAVGVAE